MSKRTKSAIIIAALITDILLATLTADLLYCNTDWWHIRSIAQIDCKYLNPNP